MKIEIDTERQAITIDGVAISLELLATLVNPDKHCFYSFERRGNLVIVNTFRVEPCNDQSIPAKNQVVPN